MGQGSLQKDRCVQIHSTTWMSSVSAYLSLSEGLLLAETCRECVGRALGKCVERFSLLP